MNDENKNKIDAEAECEARTEEVSEEIKKGDVVVLKSGGPWMTVVSRRASVRGGRVTELGCKWFDADGNPKSISDLPVEAVELCEDDDDEDQYRSPPNVHVYYGVEGGWNQDELERAQQCVGHECDGFDGLQADFCVDPEKVKDVVEKLNDQGFLAEAVVDGKKIGRSVSVKKCVRVYGPSGE